MSAPLLAALLARALPGLRALDLGLPAPLLFPWLPGTLCGVENAAALPVAEQALLRRFRQEGGRRALCGFDPAGDAALLAGAPAAWGEAAERLLRLAGPAPAGLPPDALLLLPGEAPDPPGGERGRIILLLGSAARVARHDLLVPASRTEALFEQLRLAGAALGGGWERGGRLVSPRLGSLALLPPQGARLPPLPIPPEALVHDLPGLAGEGRLPLGPRLRLLLGTRPARLRLQLAAVGSVVPALFLDGLRHPAGLLPGPEGSLALEAEVPPLPEGMPERALVLGLALPGGGAAALTGLELLP